MYMYFLQLKYTEKNNLLKFRYFYVKNVIFSMHIFFQCTIICYFFVFMAGNYFSTN